MEYPFDLVNKYIIEGYHIDITKKYEIVKIPARKLFCPERIDFMAKWIYIDAYEKKMDMTDAIHLYSAHLDAFSRGTFVEPGEEWKNTLQVYLNTFNSLIEEIKANGFDERKSLIPVGANETVLDGSHRVAVAAYFEQTVTIIRFPEVSQDFGTEFFRSNLLSSKYLDRLVVEYLKHKDNCYFACLWPVAYEESKLKQAEKIISEYGKIVYSRDVMMNRNGLRNFMIQIYGHQAWVGTYENKYEGVDGKVTPCYAKGKATHTIVFSADCLDSVLEIKKRIRQIYRLENHSIHISDNMLETKQMAELLYNENSMHHLNYGKPDLYKTVNARVKEFKELVLKNDMELSRFIVDSGSVLEIYGLRLSRDLDYLTDYSDIDFLRTENCDNHISELSYYNCSVSDLIYNPNNYFVCNGVKFVSLTKLQEMKSRRGEKKDKRDVKFIRKCWRKRNLNGRFSEEHILRYERKQNMYGIGPLSIKEYILCRLKKMLGRG